MGTAIPSKIYRAIFEALNDKESYPKHHSIQLVYFHNADDNKDKWDGGEHAALKKTIKGILKDMKPVEEGGKFKFSAEDVGVISQVSPVSNQLYSVVKV